MNVNPVIHAPIFSPDLPRIFLDAIERGDEAEVDRCFREREVSVFQMSGLKFPLHIAAEKGRTSIVQKILNAGAPLEQKDLWIERTAIIAASRCECFPPERLCDHVSVIDLLLRRGADPNGEDRWCWTALMHATYCKRPRIMERLLEAGAQADHKELGHGMTALMYAAEMGNLIGMAILLNRGARTDVAAKSGQTALHMAAEQGYPGAVELLLDRGAHVNQVDNRGRTALFFAVRKNSLSTATLLLDRGADPNLGGTDGITPLTLATDHSYQGLVALLRSRGAHGGRLENSKEKNSST